MQDIAPQKCERKVFSVENNELYEKIKNSFDKQGFLSTIGAKLCEVECGKTVISCESRSDLTQQNGFMHAGVITTIADVACGYAAMTTAADGYNVMSVEFKQNLLRPMTGTVLKVTGSVVKTGKTLIVTQAEAVDADSGKLIATMLGTMIAVKEK